MRGARAAAAVLCAAAARSASGAATEVRDAARVKARFGKKELKRATVLGYLPSFEDVEAFSAAAKSFPNLPFYYVHDRSALDTLGAVTGTTSVVAAHRPWAGSKKFKTTFRGKIKDNKKFLDWVANEVLPPASFVTEAALPAYADAAERQRKALVKVFIPSEIDDPKVTKPGDWDQPEQIPDPSAEVPSDWDADEDGEWTASNIPNPEFKGEWTGKRMSTLIPDSDDEKPEDWDQPEVIPDPRSSAPEDWNEEDDGVFEPPDIPNPAFKGNWSQAEIPEAAPLKLAQDILKPVADKHGSKVFTVVCAVPDDDDMGYGFTAKDLPAGKAIAIEEPKYSAMKQSNIWLKYKYPEGKDVNEWVGEWAAKKLTDMDKQKRQDKKAKRLEKSKKDEL